MSEILQGLQNTASGAGNFIVILIVGIVLVAIGIFVFFMVKEYKKWSQFEVRVWSTDAFGQAVERKDKGGIFLDKKTNSKRFFVKNCKADLPPDNVPIVYIKGKQIVYIKKIGSKNFEYFNPADVYSEIKNKELAIVTEQDVNWAVNDYERQKIAFSKNSWMQYLPFIALAIVGIIIMIIFIYLFKKLDVLQAFGQSLVEAARILNPTVIQ